MRVLVAPDSFGGTLTAVEAAAAIAAGWSRRAPRDELVLAPMSDGGPGFVDVLHASLGGELLGVTVLGTHADETPAAVLMVEDTAYVESAQAAGTSGSDSAAAERATSYGVGQLVAAAVDEGAARIIVGLGGVASNDGGAGLLAALGATSEPAEALVGGSHALELLDAVRLDVALERTAGVELVFATDVDTPLVGLRGTTNLFGADKGIDRDRLLHVDAQLERLAASTERALADHKGAGAAGGIGFALLLLGASRVDGVGLVSDAIGLPELARTADLVLTGEGSFDFGSRSGKVPYGVARIATQAIRPCVALAGQVLVGSREMRALGIESAYSVAELVGEEASFADPAAGLAALAERVARTWSR